MEKKYIVRLTDEERLTLRSVIRKLQGSSQKVRRAQILLKADAEARRSPILAIPTLKELLRQDPNDMAAMGRLAEANVKTVEPGEVDE